MQYRVKYIDYAGAFRRHEQQIMSTIQDVLGRGDLMLRSQLRDFETHLAEFCGTKHAVGVSNCTDGLHLILRALGIGAGDEVITVSHTFVATAAAVHHAGATPVLVDIGDDHVMDAAAIEQAISPRTKAILPVQLNGRIADMQTIQSICKKHNLILVEDAAQALGATYNGTKGGAFGAAAAFSFYPAKLLGAFGDGGAVTTNDDGIAAAIRALRDHGRTPSGELAGWSFNCRLDNLQAAILDLRLSQLPEDLVRRRELAAIYDAELRGVPGLHLPPAPSTTGAHYDVFQNYEIESDRRDQLVAYLRSEGVETMLPWGGRGVHQHPALGLTHHRLPRTELLFRRVVMLPMHTELTDEQVRYTADVVRRFHHAGIGKQAA